MSNGSDGVDVDDDEDTVPFRWPPGADEQYIFSYGRALEPKFSNPSLAGYYRPWRFIDKKRSGISRVFYARSREFRIALDVSQFPPENISVKVAGDLIVVEARHPNMADYLGNVQRECVRKYKTPPDLKMSTITGKHKRGILILWGERELDQPTGANVELVKDEIDSIIISRKSIANQRTVPEDGQLGGLEKMGQATTQGNVLDANARAEVESRVRRDRNRQRKV